MNLSPLYSRFLWFSPGSTHEIGSADDRNFTAFSQSTPSSLPLPFLLSGALPVSQCWVCSALRDFKCYIEAICILGHVVSRAANRKSEEFLANQSAQGLGLAAGQLIGECRLHGLMVWMPQLLFQSHDGPLLTIFSAAAAGKRRHMITCSKENFISDPDHSSDL